MPASQVVSSLRRAGNVVHLVNPHDKRCNKDLVSIGKPIDVVNLCINSYNGLILAKQAAQLGVKRVFIQPGAESRELLDFLQQNNIEVYQGCVMIEMGRRGR